MTENPPGPRAPFGSERLAEIFVDQSDSKVARAFLRSASNDGETSEQAVISLDLKNEQSSGRRQEKMHSLGPPSICYSVHGDD